MEKRRTEKTSQILEFSIEKDKLEKCIDKIGNLIRKEEKKLGGLWIWKLTKFKIEEESINIKYYGYKIRQLVDAKE